MIQFFTGPISSSPVNSTNSSVYPNPASWNISGLDTIEMISMSWTHPLSEWSPLKVSHQLAASLFSGRWRNLIWIFFQPWGRFCGFEQNRLQSRFWCFGANEWTNPLEASKGLNEQSRGSASFGRKTFCRMTVGSIVMADSLNILTSNFEGGATEFRGKACAFQTSRPKFESRHSVKLMLNGFSGNVSGEKWRLESGCLVNIVSRINLALQFCWRRAAPVSSSFV